MKKSVIVLGLILTLGSMVVSCSHQTETGPNRFLASQDCPVKGEYHSYFDQVEKCIEKSEVK